MTEKEIFKRIFPLIKPHRGRLGSALIIWYGGCQVMRGQGTPRTFFSFLTALIMIYEPIKRLSGVNSTIQQGMAAAIRVFALLGQRPETIDKRSKVDLPFMRRGLELQNVSFSIKKGEIIALVGPSGSGKSTIANLILRFFEVSRGQILINGLDTVKSC